MKATLKETLLTILIVSFIALSPFFMLIYLLFYGYPNDYTSIAIGILCAICGVMIARKGNL